ncbi:MAG TPA: hypothetical protein VKE69_01125 [Planctomycetota bacterium]|nr:hypothetical protein [Planctomycetota bacterium]
MTTVVAGVAAAIATALALGAESEVGATVDGLLLVPSLSRVVLGGLALAATVGGTLVLRGHHSGPLLASCAWACAAALAVRPSVRFVYAEGALPKVDLPAQGRSIVALATVAVAAALLVLSRRLGAHTGRRARASAADIGVGTFLIVCGLLAAVAFRVEVERLGAEAHERVFVPLLAASLTLHVVGLTVLAGWTVGRAAATAILLAIAASALVPDLLFDRLRVEPALLWSPIFAGAAIAMLLPGREVAAGAEEV